MIGPNNSPSPDMLKHLKSAGIPLTEVNLNNFEQVLYKHVMSNENSWSKMPPSEFDLLVLP